jgi:hypothetical protein
VALALARLRQWQWPPRGRPGGPTDLLVTEYRGRTRRPGIGQLEPANFVPTRMRPRRVDRRRRRPRRERGHEGTPSSPTPRGGATLVDGGRRTPGPPDRLLTRGCEAAARRRRWHCRQPESRQGGRSLAGGAEGAPGAGHAMHRQAPGGAGRRRHGRGRPGPGRYRGRRRADSPAEPVVNARGDSDPTLAALAAASPGGGSASPTRLGSRPPVAGAAAPQDSRARGSGPRPDAVRSPPCPPLLRLAARMRS